MSFDGVTVLVGANSTGKSSILHALEWFFAGGAPTEEDISGHRTGEQVTVGVTFTDSTHRIARHSPQSSHQT